MGVRCQAQRRRNTMLDQLEQMQMSPVISFLPALLKHTDFQEGLQEGQQSFQDVVFPEDHEKAWTEEEIIELVEWEVTDKRYLGEQRINQAMGKSPLSCTHDL